jgi:hypothetical protein
MEVERTIEFIVDMQAKSEARMDKFDKRLEATRRLVEGGMKFIVKSQRNFDHRLKEFDHRLKEIAELQNKTDLKLNRLIDAWA